MAVDRTRAELVSISDTLATSTQQPLSHDALGVQFAQARDLSFEPGAF
jgi:hypothetical protein